MQASQGFRRGGRIEPGVFQRAPCQQVTILAGHQIETIAIQNVVKCVAARRLQQHLPAHRADIGNGRKSFKQLPGPGAG